MHEDFEPVRADAISAAALPEPNHVIEVLVVAGGKPQAFLIGTVTAKSLIVLLRESLAAIEGRE